MSAKVLIVAALVVSQALDLITTYVGFAHGLREGNPLPAWCQSIAGDASLVLVKILAVVIVVGIALMLQRQYPKLWYGVVAATCITFMVVASNAVSIALAMG